MQHPDEGTIHTWLDGELLPDYAAELEAHVAECSECAAAVAEARGFIAGSSRIVSALDIVPGDVIPLAAPTAAPTAAPLAGRYRRSWYSNTQFRAAAAVFFVAGASLILFRDGKEAKMTTAMDGRAAESAPVEEATAQPMVSEQDARALKGADQAKNDTSAAKAVESQVTGGSAQKEKRREISSASTAPAALAPVTTAPPAANSQGRMRADASRAPPREMVATGVAEAAAPTVAPSPLPVAPMRVVRADTSGAIVRTTFEVRPGVEVILTETRVADAAGTTAIQGQLKGARSKTSSPSPSPRAASVPAADAVRVESVSWVSAVSGKSYVFSGPLTKEQLTVLRSRLPLSSR